MAQFFIVERLNPAGKQLFAGLIGRGRWGLRPNHESAKESAFRRESAFRSICFRSATEK
jgi:hypothetical protein